MIYSVKNNKKEVARLHENFKSSIGLELPQIKELLQRTHSLLLNGVGDENSYNLGLSVICHIASNPPRDRLLCKLLYDCIVQSRIFLYDGMIKSVEYQSENFSNYDFLSKEFYTLEKSTTVLTRDQKKLFDLFQERKRIVVSAPTSFGKSRIIQEIIIHNSYKNILVVLPTIALLNETYVRFKNNNQLVDKYFIYNSLGVKDITFPKEKNIFILTPEKSDLLIDRHPYLKFDFFTMDEIYKIQDGDDRSKIFINCLYKLSKIPNINFYLIGPYFKGFSQRFLEKTNSEFRGFRSEIVQKDDLDINEIAEKGKYLVNNIEIRKLKDIRLNLRNIINAIDDQTIVYRGQKKYYTELTASFLIGFKKRDVESDLIDYISENISPEWTLVKCLKAGIAFHHGALPKYIQTEIIDSFNANELDIIVCTSTIVEGVNTTAKNVIIYDQYKGDAELSGFDVKNIKGRAGRFLSHFIGNIYSLVPLKHEEDKGIIEFSFYDDKNLENEDVLQVDTGDLLDKNLAKKKRLEALLKEANVPLDVIKNNKFISIEKQVSLIEHLREVNDDELYFSGNLPTSDQLKQVLLLCYEHLFTVQHHDDKNYTIDQLIRLTQFYVYKKPSLKQLISDVKSENIDTKIRNTFNLISNYFEFALPKYLAAFENLYNLVRAQQKKKQVNFVFLITVLEFGHSENHEIALKEAGLPNDIIKKVSKLFQDCNSLDQIRFKVKFNPAILINSHRLNERSL